MANALSEVKHRTKQHLCMTEGKAAEKVCLHLGLSGVLLIRAVLLVVLKRVLPGHLQTSSPLLLFGVFLGKLGFYLGRVNVGVEIGHDGKDYAH